MYISQMHPKVHRTFACSPLNIKKTGLQPHILTFVTLFYLYPPKIFLLY